MTLSEALKNDYKVEVQTLRHQFDDVWVRIHVTLSHTIKSTKTGAYMDVMAGVLDDPEFLYLVLDRITTLAHEAENDTEQSTT